MFSFYDIKINIKGHPLVLKNSKQIVVVNGRRLIKSNPRVEAYQHRAIAEVCDQIGHGFEVVTEPVHVRLMFYGAWKRDSKRLPDLDNLLCLPCDLLEAAGVIESDSQIEAFDWSRRICMCDTCDARPVYKAGPKKGLRKPDCGAVKQCPNERVEISINRVGGKGGYWAHGS